MEKILNLILATVALATAGCSGLFQNTDLTLVELEPRITVFSFLNPHRVISAFVAPSIGVQTGGEFVTLEDAKVVVFESLIAVDTLRRQNNLYVSHRGLKPTAGGSYHIQVTHPDYPTATSEVVIVDEESSSIVLETTHDSLNREISFEVPKELLEASPDDVVARYLIANNEYVRSPEPIQRFFPPFGGLSLARPFATGQRVSYPTSLSRTPANPAIDPTVTVTDLDRIDIFKVTYSPNYHVYREYEDLVTRNGIGSAEIDDALALYPNFIDGGYGIVTTYKLDTFSLTW